MAARPNLIANPSAPIAPLLIGDNGVPERGEGESSEDKGVTGVARERRPFGALVVLTEMPRLDCRRWGVASDDVDLESGGSARERGSVVLRARLGGGGGEDNRTWLPIGDITLPTVGEGFSSSSVHCKWRMTDFVAHWADYLRGKTHTAR